MREMPWLPRILRPDYTWPTAIAPSIAITTPAIPRMPPRCICRFQGLVHEALIRFSQLYCSWIQHDGEVAISDLPFGLLVKQSEKVRMGEAAAMQMARAAGMPVPKLITYGEAPPSSGRPWDSILMTRLPGFEMINTSDEEIIDELEKGTWVGDLSVCLEAMRSWESPYGAGRICSVIGGSIKSSRVPMHEMGPFKDESEMHRYLLWPASSRSFKSKEEFQRTMVSAQKIQDMRHRVVFTHGDFKHHNILVDPEGNLTGILDWESAGWCPEYWEFCTAMRFGSGSFWYSLSSKLGGGRYLDELVCDKSLNKLTVDAIIG